MRARRGDPDVPPRTQPGLAVSADGVRWSILNAGPDLRGQLAAFPALHPKPGTRDVPLDTVALTSAELDHVLGLLVLREALSFRIVSTHWVREAILEHNAAWRLLQPIWGAVPLDAPVSLDRDGALEARFFPVAPKVPSYLRDVAKPHAETTTGLRITEVASGRAARVRAGPRLARLGHRGRARGRRRALRRRHLLHGRRAARVQARRARRGRDGPRADRGRRRHASPRSRACRAAPGTST